jgi:transcriptional regulator with XRE-family HTH domain
VAQESPGARVGRTLRALREERLLSQAALAQAAGVSLATIEKIERGLVPHPRRTTLGKLARPLAVTLEELIGPPRPLTSVPPEAPAVELPAMYHASDEQRRRALADAGEDEISRYLAELDRQLASVGAELQTIEGQQQGNKEGLLRYLQSLLDLRTEAAPYVAQLPPGVEEMAHRASVPGAA